jgi:hypothetical protein
MGNGQLHINLCPWPHYDVSNLDYTAENVEWLMNDEEE